MISSGNKKTDAIVVGMNVAGATASKELASLCVNTIVVERYSRDKIGIKTCGDGLEKHEFQRLNIPIPEGDFVIRDINKGELFSPDMKSSIAAKAEGRGINRYQFNQYLVKKALDAGVEIFDRTIAESPILKGHGKSKRVAGIKIRNRKGETREIEAEMVVDCSGVFAKIRNQLPKSWWVSEKVAQKDTAVCYRENRALDHESDELFVRAYFSQEVAPGAFYWIGCRDLRNVNIGIGVLRVPGYQNPRRQFYTKLLKRHPFLEKGKITWISGGVVPTRRPLDCMVANGFIAVGDAACQVNPISGGGIGPSLFAGRLAANVINKALESNDTSIESLWIYNTEYNHQYGFVQAGGNAMRLSLFSLRDSDMNKLLGARLLSDKEILYAIEHGKLQARFAQKLKMARKLVKYPKLLFALKKMQSRMEKSRALYLDFPETPKNFLKWRKKVHRFFDSY